MQIEDKTATEIFGTPDDKKLQSSMTLFSMIENANPVFKKLLDKYFMSIHDVYTVEHLEKSAQN